MHKMNVYYRRKEPKVKPCFICGADFHYIRLDAKCCGAACRKIYQRIRQKVDLLTESQRAGLPARPTETEMVTDI